MRACRKAVTPLPFQLIQWSNGNTSMIGSNSFLFILFITLTYGMGAL